MPEASSREIACSAVARKAPGGLGSRHVLGGYLAGIAVMYVTGLLI